MTAAEYTAAARLAMVAECTEEGREFSEVVFAKAIAKAKRQIKTMYGVDGFESDVDENDFGTVSYLYGETERRPAGIATHNRAESIKRRAQAAFEAKLDR